jgi:carbon monoxide dehydrogenase subunit G
VEASEQFTVKSSQRACWDLVSTLPSIGSCIPGCESVTAIDDLSALFKVKVKIGYVSKTFEMKAVVIDTEPLRRLSFRAEGKDAEIHGSLLVEPLENSEVKISYQIKLIPISMIAKTAVSMMGKDIVNKQASEFASCLRSRLEPNPTSA